MQRQLWPPVRPVGSLAGGGGALPAQRTRWEPAGAVGEKDWLEELLLLAMHLFLIASCYY